MDGFKKRYFVSLVFLMDEEFLRQGVAKIFGISL